ncbi:retrovirus-related pol polyprotein from transposon TNT 1-94 [Tanacetum coccineum]
MTTLAEHIIVARAENRPLMLEKSMYDSWASRIRLFIKWKKHGRMMLDSIDNGPLVYPTVEENGNTRPKKYSELTKAQKIQEDCDVHATNIILHGLSPDVYALVNHQEVAKDIWDRVKMLMKGTKLLYQERECRLYNLFDKFAHVLVNTKFLNALPSKWSKFVIDVKLAKSLYTTNYDQLYAYLSQHERHANEVRITRERYSNSLAFIANSPTLYNPSQSPQHSSYSMYPAPQQFTTVYAAPIHHPHYHTPVNPQQHPVSPPPFISPSVTRHSQADFPQLDSGLDVPTFQQGEDLIECINKAMAFLSVVASRFPPSNNQLRTSSNPRNQATIQGGRVTTDDLDAYDSDCNDLSLAKTDLMANLSSCDLEVLSEVPYSESYPCDTINQDVQEMQYFEQTHVDDFEDNEIHSSSNIISYSQYLQETQDAVIQDTKPSAPNDLLVLFLVEQMTDHVAHLDKENQTNKMIKEDYGKHFVTKKELSAEQAFWLKHSSLSETPVMSHTPIRIEAPSELPKVSLVNESLKKLKYQLANFEKVVKKRLTSDAITAGSWGFKHTKECFLTELIPFLKVLNDTFNAFDKTLLHEITEVQTVFNQIEVAFDQCSVNKNVFEIQIKQLRIDNDQLLNQIMSQEIVHIVENYVDILDVKKSCVNDCNKCLELEIELFKKKDFVEKELYDKLVKSYSNLEKHCISLELATQLNQEIFQRENSGENLNAPTFNQLFEINELKTQSQAKDTIIRKLKERIKSLSGKDSVQNVKKDIDEIETINIELEHNQFDSIGKTRVQLKEYCDSLIAQINAKSFEILDLNAQLQEKVFAITTLKNELRKIKGKDVVNTMVSKSNANLAPGMFKLDINPISARLKNNRDTHEVYIEKTIEYADTLCGFELLVYASQTCPNSPKLSEKLVAVTPINKEKRVRFAEPVTSSNNSPKHTDSLKTKDSNKPLLTSTGVKPTTSASGSKPSGNTKNNRISRPPRSNQKSKVEDHPRTAKSSLNKMNYVSEPISNALVKHSVRNAKFESVCAICSKCLFDANHDMCLVDFVNDVNVSLKSKSKKKEKSLETYGITPNKILHLKETTPKSAEIPKPEIKVVQIVLWYLDSGCSKTYDREPLSAHELPSKTKSWLWHRRLSHLNFGTFNKLTKDGLARGIPKLKFQKDHLCSVHSLGKRNKSSHQPKAEDTNQEKLYLLHMYLYGPMRMESIKVKKYILVIVDDYSRFTWVKFLRSKDEAPDAIIKCIKNIQVRLNVIVCNV